MSHVFVVFSWFVFLFCLLSFVSNEYRYHKKIIIIIIITCIGASEASPFLVMNVAILSVWTGTIFVFCTRDSLPNFT